MAATKTKRNRRLADVVKVPEAIDRMKVTRSGLYQLIELGYFTPRRMSPLSAQSRRLIFVDEIDRYLELTELYPLPRDRKRIEAGMKQHRAEAGRLS